MVGSGNIIPIIEDQDESILLMWTTTHTYSLIRLLYLFSSLLKDLILRVRFLCWMKTKFILTEFFKIYYNWLNLIEIYWTYMTKLELYGLIWPNYKLIELVESKTFF